VSDCLGGLVWLVDHYGVLSKFYDRLLFCQNFMIGLVFPMTCPREWDCAACGE